MNRRHDFPCSAIGAIQIAMAWLDRLLSSRKIKAFSATWSVIDADVGHFFHLPQLLEEDGQHEEEVCQQVGEAIEDGIEADAALFEAHQQANHLLAAAAAQMQGGDGLRATRQDKTRNPTAARLVVVVIPRFQPRQILFKNTELAPYR